jgi:hypothetical protein
MVTRRCRRCHEKGHRAAHCNATYIGDLPPELLIVILSYCMDVDWPGYVRQYRLVCKEFEAAVPAALRDYLGCLKGEDAIIRQYSTPLVTEELQARPVAREALWPMIQLSVIRVSKRMPKGNHRPYWFWVNYKSLTLAEYREQIDNQVSIKKFREIKGESWPLVKTEIKRTLELEIAAMKGVMRFFKDRYYSILDATFLTDSPAFHFILYTGNKGNIPVPNLFHGNN